MPWYAPWKKEQPAPAPLQEPKLALDPPPPLPAKAPSRGIIAASIPPGDWGSQHPGRGLTADVIRGAFDAAEVGWPAQQCDIFDDLLERDGHLRSLVEGRIQAVAGKGWIVQPGGDDEADVKAARALELALRRIPNIQQTWEHLLSAVFYGYAGCELEWDVVDGLIVPTWIANVPHRRFRFDRVTDEPRLVTDKEWVDGIPLERGKWIWASMRGRRTERAGLMRPATWWSWLKSLSIRDWQIFAARFGLPFVTARHSPDADEALIGALKEAVLAFGKNGGAVFSNQGELEIKEPVSAGNSASVHPALADMCNREMSKLISGATLTSGEGTSAGSYALGRVHENQSFNFTLADAERLSGWFTADLGAAFVAFNNMKARPPRLKVRVVREVDPLSRMQIADLFVNQLGGTLDADQMREEYDFKVPTGEALRGAVVSTAPPKPSKEDLARTPEEWARMNAAADARLGLDMRILAAAARSDVDKP